MSNKDGKVLAIIPARGGSKGIPKKNIIDLCGKPLLAYSIATCLKSKLIDITVVSSDDDEILAVAKAHGSEILKRPKELAQDSSPSIDAIRHVVNHYESKGEKIAYVAMIEPTSPLRKDDDFDKAIKLLKESKVADSLVSVGEIATESPFISKVITDGFVKPFVETKSNFYQRQQLPKVYFPYGVIYMSKRDALLDKGTFYQEKTIPYFIERWQNYEIDSMPDLVCTRAIMEWMKK